MLCAQRHSICHARGLSAGLGRPATRFARCCASTPTPAAGPAPSVADTFNARLERLLAASRDNTDDYVEALTQVPEVWEALLIKGRAMLRDEIPVYNTSKLDEPKKVRRASLLEASHTEETLQGYLKEVLGMAPGQPVKLTWGDSSAAGASQHELITHNPLAFNVGKARSWFVEEL